MWFLGIDPGKTGGIAWLDDDSLEVHVVKMPPTYRDVWKAIGSPVGADNERVSCACLERICGAPPGKTTMQAITGVRESFGACLMALTAAEIRCETVMPVKWQGVMGVRRPRGKEETQSEKKNRHKAKAQELFPQEQVTHAIADALLLVEYARRTMA